MGRSDGDYRLEQVSCPTCDFRRLAPWHARQHPIATREPVKRLTGPDAGAWRLRVLVTTFIRKANSRV
jgi:hypothetical protein